MERSTKEEKGLEGGTPGPGNGGGGDPGHGPIEILVNERSVSVQPREQTGLAIKQAAIAQGVAIELEFVLSLERGEGRTELIGDSDPVKVHKHERFLAIPNDDNS